MNISKILLVLLGIWALVGCGVDEDAYGYKVGDSRSPAATTPTPSTGGGTTTPSLSTTLTLTPASTEFTATWTAVTGATSYSLFYAEEPFSSLSDVSNYATLQGGNLIQSISATTLTQTVSSLVNGKTYYVVVAAFDNDSLIVKSSEKTVTPTTITATLTNDLLLNDTGASYSVTNEIHDAKCLSGLTVAQQDCSMGRDYSNYDVTDGAAGFSFTKIDATGSQTESSTEWDCVKDNHTGLMWQRKRGGNGVVGDEHSLSDADDGFTWYQPAIAKGGVTAGTESGSAPNSCAGYSAGNVLCNTSAYVSRVNTAKLCSFGDWRLPTSNELMGIVFYKSITPSVTVDAIDEDYFPFPDSTLRGEYWTSSPYKSDSGAEAWRVVLRDTSSTTKGKTIGVVKPETKATTLGVLLVRDASND